MNRYEDIMDLPHHVSAKRARMSQLGRAAQFAPFAALTGYDAAIQETGRLTDLEIELDADGQAALNEKLCLLAKMHYRNPEVTLTYFLPDERKAGGAYVSTAGRIKKIDLYEQEIVMTDGVRIPICRLYDIAFKAESKDSSVSPPSLNLG